MLFFIENAGKLGYKDCYRFVLFLQWFVHWLYKSSYSPTLLNNRLFMNLITDCLAPVFRTLNTCTCNMFLWCHKMVCLNISLFIYVSVKIFVKYFNTNHAIWLKLTNEILLISSPTIICIGSVFKEGTQSSQWITKRCYLILSLVSIV